MKYLSTLFLIFNLAFTFPAWSNFYRDSFTDERIQNFKTGWVVNEKLLAQRCFVQEWFSSDNFQAIAEHFKIEDEDNFFINPGLYIGSKLNSYEPLDVGWDEKVFFTMKIEDCITTPEAKVMHDGTVVEVDPEYDTENYYRLLHSITTDVCNELAPSANSQCLEAYLIRVGEETGGSIGDEVAFGIYGLFDLPKVGLSIVPLKYFRREKSNGLDFIYGEGCPANEAIYTSSDGLKTFKTTHFAIKQSLGCTYTLFDDEDNGTTFGFRLPPEGYYDTIQPTYYELKRTNEKGSLMCSQNKYIMLRGKVDDEVAYVWDETIKAAPCCVNYSLSERGFKERLEQISFSSDIIWLQDELVPMAKTEIDTITNNDYYSNFEQPLGEDIYALTGCRQNETLYGDKHLKAAKIKALKYASENKEHEAVTIKDSDGETLNGMKVGHWKYYDNRGELWSEGSYKDGKKDGIWTDFDKDGLVSVKETWIDGILVGPWISYVSGKVSAEGQYDNDAKSGHWKYYDNAGKLWSEGSYKNGKKDGLWTTYNTDSSISETTTWVDGE